MPIKDASGEVVGVAQVINKQSGESSFTEYDEKVGEFFFYYYFLSNAFSILRKSKKFSYKVFVFWLEKLVYFIIGRI